MQQSLTAEADLGLRQKVRSSDIVFSLKLAILTIGSVAGGYLASWHSTAFVVVGIILLGLWQAHAVELQHQVLHGLGYRNARINHLVGVLLGLPMLVSYSGYRASHLRHHRLLGTPDNKEFFDYGDQYGGKPLTIYQVALRLLMLQHYVTFARSALTALRNKPFDGESKATSDRMRFEYLLMLAAICALLILGLWLHEWRPLIAWAASFALVATPVHALIEMPEHYLCDMTTTDVFANTRSIKSNLFLTWFTNGNNYHVEHHLAPGLPMEALPDLFDQNVGKHQYVEPTYREFFHRVWMNNR
ncbi:fatty acid desaturase [Bradyrhizobium sp. BR 10261]|uniref:fatty acid desaturase family protein n=1 Tax=Bradyrhizobium sp. BR 10261 TaxID=2749992 RepID=UPI001C652301|nr:fatty acid desaturase [Bradyrhizobium sp. BR 10261]MBW7962978.1 fatty acid desaturase [Bradyrhizobium sp. BR 10261]